MHGIATIKKLNDDKNFNKQALEALRQPKSVFGWPLSPKPVFDDKGQPKFVLSVGKQRTLGLKHQDS